MNTYLFKEKINTKSKVRKMHVLVDKVDGCKFEMVQKAFYEQFDKRRKVEIYAYKGKPTKYYFAANMTDKEFMDFCESFY